ncbi:MAG: nuclear transport factor 2 family protein [Actinobacteria bacterium]|nr:MAG: nuclear transport factor 2 family protein [Actinomycetota bacterium]
MRRVVARALALPAFQALYSAVFGFLLRRAAGRLMAGDVDAFLRFYADDAEVSFPGGSSWGRVYRGKAEIRGFLERFLRAGLREPGDDPAQVPLGQGCLRGDLRGHREDGGVRPLPRAERAPRHAGGLEELLSFLLVPLRAANVGLRVAVEA